MMRAIDQLKSEHDGILVMLSVMEKISEQKEIIMRDFEKILDFLINFVDKCHHGKEEGILFPELESMGIEKKEVSIEALIEERAAGRDYVKKIYENAIRYRKQDKKALPVIQKNVKQYVKHMRAHIDKENDTLFAMANKVLGVEIQEDLSKEFERLEVEKIGLGKHNEYHELIEQLEEKYL